MNELINTDFETFWELYPRKQDKKKAQVKYEELSDVDKFNCMRGAENHRDNNLQWKTPSLVPLPTTFINGERWNDEIPMGLKEKIIQNEAKTTASTVWSALTQLYGQAWINKFGEQPPEIWRKMLANIPEHRIKRGLRGCVDHCPEFPPSLPKFIELCSPTFGEQTQQPQLPPPECSEKVALESIQKMKEILGV